MGTGVLGMAGGTVARLNPYLGPELALYADHTGYRKWNLGVHATDFTVGRFSLRTSAGLQFEPRDSASPYVSLTVWTPW